MAAPIVRARLSGSLFPLRIRCLSTQTAVQPENESDGTKGNFPAPYRTNVDSPTQHRLHHIGKFYTVPKNMEKGIFQVFKLSKGSMQLIDFVGEMAIMVREPFIEARDYIESYDYSQPALRMMLYGRMGSGKAYTLAHLLHYGVEKDWLLISNSWMPTWLKRPTEVQPAEDNAKILETPVEGAIWLQQFRLINAPLLEKLQLVTTKAWKFSDTESVASGEPLLNLVTHGVERVKHSNQAVRALLQEIKAQTHAGNTKTMVLLSGVNCLWEMSYQRDVNQKFIHAENFHLLQSFREILKNDWKNAAIVTSVAPAALSLTHRELTIHTVPSYMPQYLLGKSGFEFFEPFLPIRVDNYSPKEIDSALDYFIDMNYIQHPRAKTDAARNELKFLSGSNPRQLRHLCRWI